MSERPVSGDSSSALQQRSEVTHSVKETEDVIFGCDGPSSAGENNRKEM